MPDAEEFKNQSLVYVGVDNKLAGVIYFEDKIREDAFEVVESLTKHGINVYMLSGDKKSTAEYVASMVGIPKDNVRILESHLEHYILIGYQQFVFVFVLFL